MTAENFSYWLQGFFELTESTELTPGQVKMIKEHLALVFKKETSNLKTAQGISYAEVMGYVDGDPLAKLC